MAEEEEEVVEGEGEEGEEKPPPPAAEAPKPSQIQVNLTENAKFVATQLDTLFATTAKIQVEHPTLGNNALHSDILMPYTFATIRLLLPCWAETSVLAIQ